MGGYWLFLFASCLLIQSLSAEGSVKANSTSAVKDNSTSTVKDNSTSAVQTNSTSAVQANSTAAVKVNSTSAVQANSTSAVQANSTSVDPDEELEKKVEQRIAALRKMEQDDIRGYADFALEKYNAEEASIYTTLGVANVTVKKAIGTMLHLRMTLEKTNCTRKDLNPHSYFRIWRHGEKEEPPKYCGPLAGDDKEQLDCKFDVFKNERSYGETVVSHECKPVKVIDDSIFDLTKS